MQGLASRNCRHQLQRVRAVSNQCCQARSSRRRDLPPWRDGNCLYHEGRLATSRRRELTASRLGCSLLAPVQLQYERILHGGKISLVRGENLRLPVLIEREHLITLGPRSIHSGRAHWHSRHGEPRDLRLLSKEAVDILR